MKLRREPKQSRGAFPVQRSDVSPGAQLSRLRSEIDRLFEDPFGALSRAGSFFEGWEPWGGVMANHLPHTSQERRCLFSLMAWPSCTHKAASRFEGTVCMM